MNSSFSLEFSNNGTSLEISLSYASTFINLIVIILGFPINCYVVRLILTGAGSGVVSEFFALNLSVSEIIIFFSIVPTIILISSYTTDALIYTSAFFSTLLIFARPSFQCCVCVERYVAVVHPVVFLKYKALRFRVAISAVMWVLVLGICVICLLLSVRIMCYIILSQFLVLMSVKAFCSVAVLRALRRPGPGEKLSAKDAEINCTKKKALWVILIFLMSMMFIYGPVIIFMSIFYYLSDQQRVYGFMVCNFTFTFAGLVQPLLYLKRAGKLPLIWCL